MSAPKIINWDLAKKEYPVLIQSIQDWFCSVTGVQTKVWFYNQPAWRNELMPVWLRKHHNLKIMYDVAWIEKQKQFRFIYAIIDGEKAVPPQQTFSERIQAEHFAYAHVFQYIKDKAAGIESAQIVDIADALGNDNIKEPVAENN